MRKVLFATHSTTYTPSETAFRLRENGDAPLLRV